MEKPFYISQLPEKTQAWIKEKTKENFLKDGMSEEEAEQKATDFLDEKVNVAEEFFGKDFYNSLDAAKDSFTPPGAEEVVKEEIDTNGNGKVEVDEMADFQKSLDDYAKKNPKGREDIPVGYRR
jgi:HD superfamily phosphohydrolase